MEKISIRDLHEHLGDYSLAIQKMLIDESVPSEYQYLLDTIARYNHYMFSEIIDYLEQIEH